MRRGGNPALYGKVVQEGSDFCAAQFAWMSLAVEEDELTNPESIAVLGSNTEVATTTNDGDLLKQAGGLLTP